MVVVGGWWLVVGGWWLVVGGGGDLNHSLNSLIMVFKCFYQYCR